MRSSSWLSGAAVAALSTCLACSSGSSEDDPDGAGASGATGSPSAAQSTALAATASAAASGSTGTTSSASTGSGSQWFSPTPLTSWQWQLSGTLDTSIDVEVYDVDMVETSDADLAALHTAGRKVICYFSAGSYEPYRPDAADFAAADKGNELDGWPGELWLDTRSNGVREIMKARLDYAKGRGCDAVEPDNVDGYVNDSGFPLTADTQLDFNRFIADEAHARGLSVGLKNDVDQLGDLVDSFDWALNEECFTYDECDGYQTTFVAAQKAVFQTEYVDAAQLDTVCAVTTPLGLSTLIKHLELDAYRVPCP